MEFKIDESVRKIADSPGQAYLQANISKFNGIDS